MRAYYEENKQLFAPASRLQVAQIFIPYGDTANDVETIAQLDQVRAALRQGDDFTATAAALGSEILPDLPRVMLTPAGVSMTRGRSGKISLPSAAAVAVKSSPCRKAARTWSS